MKTKFFLLMLIGILFSCTQDDAIESKIIDMRINHYKNTGLAVGPVLTLLIQEGNNMGTDRWTKFYTNIDGFTYEPGRIYTLKVKVEPIYHPPADGSSLKYTLIEVVSTQEVSDETLFDIDLKRNGENFITTDSGLKLLNQIDIDCNSICNELETTIQNQDLVIGTFRRISNNEIQLVELE